MTTFDPFATVPRAAPLPSLPSEPAVGSVLGWAYLGRSMNVAIRHEDGWYLAGEEDRYTWAELVAQLVDERDPVWVNVGLVTGWTPLHETHPWPDNDDD